VQYLSKTVWILSIISLFTDVASEMLYPVMPIYLKSIGFSVVFIGILEGFAEASSGLSKGYFGKLSDLSGKRLPFIQIGYLMSAISKPMLAMFVNPIWIFLTRTIDRFGKGVRTGARDAMLSDEATFETKGRVFGFHRSMDTLGAAIGPIMALIYLHFYPNEYKTLFLLAFIPGILSILATLLLKEKVKPKISSIKKNHIFSFLGYWKESNAAYRKLVIGLLIFTLFNSSDVFLLLKAKESGLDDSSIIMVYIFYNFIYALFAYPIGVIADRIGLKYMFTIGLAIFSVVYFGMSLKVNLLMYLTFFFLYAIYASATEGVSKAWISNICEKKDTATAIGTFMGLQSIFSMLASSITGIIWYYFGASTAFILIGSVSSLLVLFFLSLPQPINK
jgi:MFS family permease